MAGETYITLGVSGPEPVMWIELLQWLMPLLGLPVATIIVDHPWQATVIVPDEELLQELRDMNVCAEEYTMDSTDATFTCMRQSPHLPPHYEEDSYTTQSGRIVKYRIEWEDGA